MSRCKSFELNYNTVNNACISVHIASYRACNTVAPVCAFEIVLDFACVCVSQCLRCKQSACVKMTTKPGLLSPPDSTRK